MIKAFNAAMDYIEAHLSETIYDEQLAQVAGCSSYHFRRMFSSLADMPLSAYIRGRRLSRAAAELQHGDIRVIDLAVRYGYTSADSFSRAFQAFHGITPTEAREPSAPLKVLLPIKFQLTVQGGNEMDYRIIEKGAFKLVGIQKRITLQYEGANPEAAAMWQSLTPADIAELKGIANIDPIGLLSASFNFEDGRGDGSQLDQFLGVATDKPHAERWQVLEVVAGTWAVFTVRGAFPDAMQQTWARIFAEWLPSADYQLRDAPEILWNEGADTTKPDYHSEIWIPVERRG